MAREYPTQCWSCLGEFDAASAVWCACSAKSATKLCPFCFRCFCQADAEYQGNFWRNAPHELHEERDLLKGASGTSGEALIRSNLLSTEQLVSALRWQQNRGAPLDDALVDLGFVSKDNLDLVASRQPAASGNVLDLSKGLIDASLVKLVTLELCYRKKILPTGKEEIGEQAILTLAMAGPTDVETIDQVQSLTDCRVIPMNAAEQDILARLNDLFPAEMQALRDADAAAPTSVETSPAPRAPRSLPASAEKSSAAAAKPARGKSRKPAPARTSPQPVIEEDLEDLEDIQAQAASAPEEPVSAPEIAPAPVAALSDAPAAGSETPIVQTILAEAIAKRASLVQLEIRADAVTLFFRIDGNLFRARPSAEVTGQALLRAVNAVASLPDGEAPAAGHLVVKAGGGRKVDVVTRRLHSAGGTSFLMKIVERSDFIRPLADLGPSALDLDRIRAALTLPNGLVLLSGPPHNGLETTRYSLMTHLGTEGRRTVSVDGPQWIAVPGIRQVEVAFPPDAARCRAALQGVAGSEVIFLPEIQNADLAALVLEASAGALVVASIQARRASQSPAALLWHQVDAKTLADRLRLVVNQRLVRSTCASCRKPSPVTDRVLKMMGLTPDEALDLKITQGTGCEACGAHSPGYAGRVALVEVMESTAEIGALIAAGGSPGEIEREARRAGMSPLRAACLARVGQGITTLEEFQKGNF